MGKKILWKELLINILEEGILDILIEHKNSKTIVKNEFLNLKKLGIKPSNLEIELKILKSLGYFNCRFNGQKYTKNISIWRINSEGIKTALKFQRHKDEERKNNAIVFFTFILAISSSIPITNFLIGINEITNPWFKLIIWLFLMIVIYLPAHFLLK